MPADVGGGLARRAAGSAAGAAGNPFSVVRIAGLTAERAARAERPAPAALAPPVLTMPSAITAMPAAWRATGMRNSGAPNRPMEVPTTTNSTLKPMTNRSACGRTLPREATAADEPAALGATAASPSWVATAASNSSREPK